MSSAQARHHHKERMHTPRIHPPLVRMEAFPFFPRLHTLSLDRSGRVVPLTKYKVMPSFETDHKDFNLEEKGKVYHSHPAAKKLSSGIVGGILDTIQPTLVLKVLASPEAFVMSQALLIFQPPMAQGAFVRFKMDTDAPVFKPVSERIMEYKALTDQQTTKKQQMVNLEALTLKAENVQQVDTSQADGISASADPIKTLCLTFEEAEEQLDFAEDVLHAFHKREFTKIANQFSEHETNQNRILGITLNPLLDVVLGEIVVDLKKATGRVKKHVAIPSRFMGHRHIGSVRIAS